MPFGILLSKNCFIPPVKVPGPKPWFFVSIFLVGDYFDLLIEANNWFCYGEVIFI